MHGKTVRPFEEGRVPRRIVLGQGVNKEIGFGGATCDLVRFRIHWHETGVAWQDQVRHRGDDPDYRSIDDSAFATYLTIETLGLGMCIRSKAGSPMLLHFFVVH